MFKLLREWFRLLGEGFKSFEGAFDLNPRPILQRKRIKYRTPDKAIAADLERLRQDKLRVKQDYLNAMNRWRKP